MGRKITQEQIVIGISILIFIIILGFLVRLMICENWFVNATLDRNVSVIDGIGIISTSFITILIAWYITKKLTAKRYEVDYLISDLKSIHLELELLQKNISELHEIDLQSILKRTTSLMDLLTRFQETTKLIGISGVDIGDCKSNILILYAITTNILGDKLILDSPKSIVIQSKISQSILSVRKLMFAINAK